MAIQETENAEDQIAGPDATVASDQKPTRVVKPARSGKSGAKTKQEQLVALLFKPNGARISTITQKLGWQAHTVRAAVSGLRKQGYEVVTSKSAKTEELVYAINAKPLEDKAAIAGAST
ncbi:DUF3489 domain-containing protein [Hoeflea sp.]|uniref:DUF3489 domain-containing protein n=1 Tax=Hoeflea sp. TaxID=1940281 RepID=UPI0025C0A103|nr:DUF3489 domain-containing protein [Hoeflea sp.]